MRLAWARASAHYAQQEKVFEFRAVFPILNGSSCSTWYLWLNLFFPILEHFCPHFVQIAQMGLILPRCGLCLPRVPPPTLFFTQPSHTPFKDIYIHKTPWIPPQNTLFSGLNLKVGIQVGKISNCPAKWTSIRVNWAKCEKWANLFWKWAKKKHSSGNWVRLTTCCFS